MKISIDCLECNVKQLVKLSKLVNANNEMQEEASKRVLKILSEINFDQSNPVAMGETWKIATEVFQEKNPYKEVKSEYNQLLMSLYEEIVGIVDNSINPLETSLKVAIVGNIIDFAARHNFKKSDILMRISKYEEIKIAKDDSKKLLDNIKTAQTIFYIGDNCGEIVLDKLFIEQIKKVNPDVSITYAVRGNTILNDVTIDDAEEVSMKSVATVISSGTQIPGTVIEKTTEEFQHQFYNSDIVIAKGQGNYESLSDTKRENLFLVLMAKCEYVARTIGCKTMDYCVIENIVS